MHIVLDYPTLRVIWWGLMGVLLIGFALTGGWDLGICAMLPFAARTDVERRQVINCAGPTWEGNQVWFILGGGSIFAAWPFVYAVSFSAFYLAMFVVLAALIMRPVGFKYRSKRPDPAWRAGWDWALFAGGLVPSLVFGVAIGNVLQGVPFHLDSDLRTSYDGTFFGLFTPFTVLCGVLSVAMVVLHGASYLMLKLEHGAVHDRVRQCGIVASLLALALFVLGGLDAAYGGLGFHIVTGSAPDGPSNPLRTVAAAYAGGWLFNYTLYPFMIAAPVCGLLGAVVAFAGIRFRQEVPALLGSALGSFGMIATVGLSMFPFILPSSTDMHSSLTVWNASSSKPTLLIMLVATLIFLPLILLYTAWVYRILNGRVTMRSIATDPDLY